MKNSYGKGPRLFALLLSVCLTWTSISINAGAENERKLAGLCPHHTEHTAECGYSLPVAGVECMHFHSESCGYADGAGCTHVHSDACGYIAASAGNPCAYVCGICALRDVAGEASGDIESSGGEETSSGQEETAGKGGAAGQEEAVGQEEAAGQEEESVKQEESGEAQTSKDAASETAEASESVETDEILKHLKEAQINLAAETGDDADNDNGPVSGNGWTLDEAGKLTIKTNTGMDDWRSNGGTHKDAVISVEIDSPVTSIGAFAFSGCSSLTEITIPGNVTQIDNAAFFGCSGLTEITIPGSVRSIGDFAFSGNSLEKITMQGGTPPTLGRYAFWACPGAAGDTQGIFVPEGKVEAYQNGTGWGDYKENITDGYYIVTVNNGRVIEGGDKYRKGDSVRIEANPPGGGKKFKEWTVEKGGVTLNDATQSTTGFTMPESAVTVTAVYEDIKYAVTVNKGTGGGEYAQGVPVEIKADDPESGKRFKEWKVDIGGVNLGASKNNPTATFTMPGNAVTMTAVYEDITYTVTVNSGTGGGEYAPGKTVTIEANPPESGKRFKEWKVDIGNVALADALSSKTTFVMPENAVTVTAEYEFAQKYTVTVTNGTGSGEYIQDTLVRIKANAPEKGKQFKEWTAESESETVTVKFANRRSASTTFKMPAGPVTITAVYQNKIASSSNSSSNTGSSSDTGSSNNTSSLNNTGSPKKLGTPARIVKTNNLGVPMVGKTNNSGSPMVGKTNNSGGSIADKSSNSGSPDNAAQLPYAPSIERTSGNNNDAAVIAMPKTRTKDSEPKTADGMQVQIYATLAMISWLVFLYMSFSDFRRGRRKKYK